MHCTSRNGVAVAAVAHRCVRQATQGKPSSVCTYSVSLTGPATTCGSVLFLGQEAHHSVSNAHHDQVGSVGSTRTRTLNLSAPLLLDSRASLFPVSIAYETYGTLAPERDNAILICHALSGDAHAAGWSDDIGAQTALDGFGAEERGVSSRSGLGWWDILIGPGKAFDTNRYFVISTNLLGSCRGSTGPISVNSATGKPYGSDFPVITVADMVRAQAAFLGELGIPSLLAVAGGSLGGMQALEWSISYPDRVRASITIASTAALSTQVIAWNAIARNAIMADPDWQGGNYYGTGRAPVAGMGVARMVGHVTYLSLDAMDRKFGRDLQDRSAYSYSLNEADYAVESYLRHQAESFGQRFDANSYLYISRALTYFDPARTYGDGSLVRALAPSRSRYLLLSFTSDWLYPSHDSARLTDALHDAGKDAMHHVIETDYGHDSFLLEEREQSRHIASFLSDVHAKSVASTSPYVEH
jgi:homoserine O-acetyltransferase